MVSLPGLTPEGTEKPTPSVDERPHRHPERAREPDQVLDSGIQLAPLDMADVIAVQTCKLRQYLLAPSTLDAQQAHPQTEPYAQGTISRMCRPSYVCFRQHGLL